MRNKTPTRPRLRSVSAAGTTIKRADCLAAVDSTKLRKWLLEPDVHSLVSPSFFIQMNFERTFVASMIRCHRSKPHHPTQVIFGPGGQFVERALAISQVDFLEHVAQNLGIVVGAAKLNPIARATLLATAILKYLDDRSAETVL